jgi:hypothetical protein
MGEQAMALTRTERKLQAEVEKIALIVDLDFWAVEEHYKPAFRKEKLQLMVDKLIRSEVVYRYTIIDELLTDVICDYYFPRKNNEHYGRLWRTKHFKIFVHFLMDETFLPKKLSMVQAILKVPPTVSSSIMRINDVRNVLAHSLFPQNRRRYMTHKKVTYKGENLFSRAGVLKFHEDYEIVENYFWKKVFG